MIKKNRGVKVEENKNEEVKKEEKISNEKEVNKNTQESTPKEEKVEPKKKKKRIRRSLVLLFLAVFTIIMYISLRGSYLEFKELGENFIPVFYTNLTYRAAIMGINFIVLYFVIYLTKIDRCQNC